MWGSSQTSPAEADTAGELHPEGMLKSLRSMGVTEETARAIRNEMAGNLEQRKPGSGIMDGSGNGGGDVIDDVRKFAKRQASDSLASASDGKSVVMWGVLEGKAGKVVQAYRALVNFVASSWELYRAELNSVTFPVFVHCYLTLIESGDGDQAMTLMKTWGGGHEATYQEDMTLLRMVKTKDHLAASEYAQLVIKNKFRVRMCLATSKLMNAFLLNNDLLVVLNIINTKISFDLEDRSPLPFRQVVRCGPKDSFPGSLRRIQAVDNGEEADIKWAAAPAMEVALLKQTERDAAAPGLDYPLSVKPEAPALAANANTKAPAAGAKGGSRSVTTTPGGVVVPTGSEAAAKAKARLLRLQAAAEATEATAQKHGGLRQNQVTLPNKPPPQPDSSACWGYLRLALRPLDSRLLNNALRTPENEGKLPGGEKPFLANPLSPHVVMLTCINAQDTLCCVKPTRDGTQVAAGFTDRVVRAWRTAPDAPNPQAADENPVPASCDPPGAPRGESVAKKEMGSSASAMVRDGAVNDGKRGSDAPEEPMRFVGHSRPVYAVSWSPDGRFLLSAGGDGGVRLWDMARGRSGNAAGYVRYNGHRGPAWDVSFGPMGYYFATASADGTACMWSTDHPQPLRMFAGHLKGVICVVFHPNGNYVVTGSADKTVRVWDVQTGNCVRLLVGHACCVNCVAVSPDGRRIAAGSSDGSIILWDIVTGKTLALLKGHTNDVECIDFSAEGSALVSGGKDDMVMIWDVVTACAGSGAKSTRAENMSAPPPDPPGHERDHAAANEPKKRKREQGAWSSTGDGPSHGPVHAFATRNTGVYSVLFTKKNLVIAAGAVHR